MKKFTIVVGVFLMSLLSQPAANARIPAEMVNGEAVVEEVLRAFKIAPKVRQGYQAPSMFTEAGWKGFKQAVDNAGLDRLTEEVSYRRGEGPMTMHNADDGSLVIEFPVTTHFLTKEQQSVRMEMKALVRVVASDRNVLGISQIIIDRRRE